ncbi:MAG: GH32 C-terminal domain-containing protein [Bacteroidales bacterium]|nr:GH32 C-terminal domain-containing protein [Bacteroidales bacterium]
MKKILISALALLMLAACGNNGAELVVSPEKSQITLQQNGKKLILPIEEGANEALFDIYHDGELVYPIDVRLAVNKVDYYLPLDLTPFVGNGSNKFEIKVSGADKNAIGWGELTLSESYDETNREYYRPVYHHTPTIGWMNDANGLVFKDGVYHLYYQYNPYAAIWGNMHWGHSTSKDLVHWEHQPIALYRDTIGHIFSGSSVVDKNNDAGFGAGAIVSFYTSHIWIDGQQVQRQCMAYSTDGGYTFTKYDKNPILFPVDGIKDFRDPKVFWYEPDKKWVMIVSADTQMRFFKSTDLKNWEFMSAWGDGYGVQPRQFECPDMFQASVVGKPNEKKWVLIVNVNPGCYFGGSATQYFVGDFDGTTFKCDTPKETVKWLDWGKDHYATVCFSNIDDRVIAVPWMSNWQYGAIVPTTQFRSANALPRELTLYKEGKEYYVASAPVKETELLRNATSEHQNMKVTAATEVKDELMAASDGAYEIAFTVACGGATQSGLRLKNDKGENLNIYFDSKLKRVVMDRTESGITDFGEKSTTHEIENHERRKSVSMNYKNDFALATWSPITKKNSYDVRIFVDKSSIELFVDGGKVAMTNLIFPTTPYNAMEFYSNGGKSTVSDLKVYSLK